jgi:hypothetical protein
VIKAGLFHGDGQPFDPQRFRRELEEGVMNAATKQVENSVNGLECPVNRRRAIVRRTSSGWEVSGCCESHKESVLAALGNQLGSR